jgi:hypothetical protein
MSEPVPLNEDDEDVMYAAVDLIGRTGAREMQVGYLHEDVPSSKADWWAHAQYRGARVSVEHHTGPVQALEALAERLIVGGKCAHCGKYTTLHSDGGIVYPDGLLADGTRVDVEEARRVGFCHWQRINRSWVRGCATRQQRRAAERSAST